MPVTVQIPDTSAYQEVTVAVDFANGVLTVGNFLYVIGGGGSDPGWILQMDKSNISNYTLLNFPNDNKHAHPIDFCHAPSTGHIYVLFRNTDTNDVPDFQLTIGRVSTASPFTLLSDFVDVHATYLPQAGSITTDDSFLYVAIWQPSNLLRYRLSDANLTVTALTGLTQASCVRYSVNKLFLTGWNAPASQWVMRMSTALAIEQSTTFGMPGNQFLEGQFAVLGNYLWITNTGTSGIVKRILKADLTTIADVSTGQAGGGRAIGSDQANVWALYQNGRGARINPGDSEVSIYTVNEGQGFQREITGDGTYIFTAS